MSQLQKGEGFAAFSFVLALAVAFGIAVGLSGCNDTDITFMCKGSQYIDGPVRSTEAALISGSVPGVERSTVSVSSGCSGVRLDPHIVLTAGHCDTQGSVGIGGVRYNVSDSYLHPGFTGTGPDWDLAVLYVDEPMPGPFPAGIYDPAAGGYEPDWRYSCERLVTEGYGKGSAGALHEQETVVTDADWLTLRGYAAGGEGGSCNGDSGGPLYALMDESFDSAYYVFGLVSWGVLGCEGYTLYVFLENYSNYIQEVRRCLAGGEDRLWEFYIGGFRGSTCEELRQ